jgi:hypothetical protein
VWSNNNDIPKEQQVIIDKMKVSLARSFTRKLTNVFDKSAEGAKKIENKKLTSYLVSLIS